MRYHVPLTQPEVPERPASSGWLGGLLGRKPAANAPVAQERLGGVPLGLAAGQWPRCADCGKSQSLLAQFAHHPDRLDLGRDGRMLLVFQCGHDPGMCESWDAFGGANAAIVVEPEALSDVPTPVPADSPPIEAGLAITGWVERDDTIPEARRAAYMADATLSAMSDAELDLAIGGVRLGGVPTWIQSADEAPAGWSFVGQLDSTDIAVYPDGTAPNFGDAGVAYLFLRPRDQGVPEACMFWQCA